MTAARKRNLDLFDLPPAPRRIYCNRTLNLRSIRAIGFDMDYTLVHYHIDAWERAAYEHVRRRLIDRHGWPLDGFEFDPQMGGLGLVMDTELGNIVKADRFGYVKRARHGTTMLSFEDQRQIYAGELVDLHDGRWRFMNTLFALSEACLWAQCVDLLDQGKISEPLGYVGLARIIRVSVDEAHMMGRLKAQVVADPTTFIDPDPDLPATLADLREAGKKVLLITNSEWSYTRDVMALAVDPHLPSGYASWRELFDLVIVGAGKPGFFLRRSPLFEVTDTEEGLLQPAPRGLREGGVFFGGDATWVERFLGLSGSELLYVGDHIYADVHVTKSLLRWRTTLIVRGLEGEIEAESRFAEDQRRLSRLMAEKEKLEHAQAMLRMELQHHDRGRDCSWSAQAARRRLAALRTQIEELDADIAPLARAAADLGLGPWGPIMRAGNDKSHLARQIERYADAYTSRVSNFGLASPHAYLRAPRPSLPHDVQICSDGKGPAEG